MNANVSPVRRAVIPLGMFLHEYARNTLNLVLLVIIPILLIVTFGDALSRLAGLFALVLTKPMGQAMGALWAASFLSGITGFYMMVGARHADRRLVSAGYSPVTVVTLRFIAVALLGALATFISYCILRTQVSSASAVHTVLVMYLAALIYGALGILVGSVIPGELEGSFALLFFFVMDAFIGSPLFGATSSAFNLLPTHYPTTILLSLTAGRAPASVQWLYVIIYLAVISALAGAAFYRAARVR